MVCKIITDVLKDFFSEKNTRSHGLTSHHVRANDVRHIKDIAVRAANRN